MSDMVHIDHTCPGHSGLPSVSQFAFLSRVAYAGYLVLARSLVDRSKLMRSSARRVFPSF